MKAHILNGISSAPMNRISLACASVLLAATSLSPTPILAQSVWTTAGGVWSSDVNWNPVAVPLSDPTTQLRFDSSGDLGYTTVNDIGAGTFTLNRITVNNTGTGIVTITGADVPTNTFSFAGLDPTLDITGTVLFNGLLIGNNSAVIRKIGPGTFIHDSNNAGFTGTLVIDAGTFMNRSTTNAVTNFNPISIVVNNGGTYQFGLGGAGDPNLPNSTYITVNTGGTMITQEGEVFGGMHLQGGTINMQSGITSNGGTAQSWTSGTLTGGNQIAGGSAAINKTGTGTVFISGGITVQNTGAFNIREGTVSMASAVNLGTSNISLGDTAGTTAGTFSYLGVTASRVGNFTINTGDGVIEVGAATTNLTLTGNFTGAGDLSKAGPGKLVLTGSLGNNGTTTVNAGTLQVAPLTALSNFAIASGAILAVNSGVGTFSFAVPSINFLSGTSVMQFDLNTNVPLTAPLTVVGNADGVVFTGTPTLRITNQQATASGTYTLLDYNGAAIIAGFNLALPGRTTGSLVYDTANTRIDVTITGTDSVRWTGGVNGDWDVGTAAGVGGTNNWRLVTAGTPTNFIQTDKITFDDSATAFNVNLTTAVRPEGFVVNATSTYTFSGPGKVSGATSLSKSGSGALILVTDNDYTEGTLVTGGLLQLGNGGTTGSIVGPVTLSGGMLGFRRSDNITFPNTVVIGGSAGFINNGTGIVTFPDPLNTGTNTVTFGGSGNLVFNGVVSGAGTHNKEGAGTLTLVANNNPFTGTLNINAGAVLLEDFGAGGDLGAAAIVVNNGGTFILGPTGNTDLPDTTLITANTGGLIRIEQGENFGGVVLNGGELRMVSTSRTGVNTTGVAAPGGSLVFDLRSGTITTDITSPGAGGALNQTNGGVLRKTTSAMVTISGGVTFQNAMALEIKEGTLAMGFGNFPTGGGGVISMGDATTNGTIQLNGVGATDSLRSFTLNVGGGTFRTDDLAGQLTVSGIINGAGALTKTGDGALVLNGANDYTGGTAVNAGRFELNNFFGSGSGSGAVSVAGTLSGTGAIVTAPGNAITITGVFQPGFTGATIGADFAVTAGPGAATTFGPSSVARFDLWSTTGTDQSNVFEAADRLVVGGDLTIAAGAVLKLTNPATLTFQVGDVFRIFDWTAAGAVTGSWMIDSSEINLGGNFLDTSNLYTAGTIAVLAVPEPGSAMFLMLGLAACTARRRRIED